MGDDGRERRGNKTARALIDAARLIFSQRGFKGAALRDIAGAAGVNVGLISYHFGSKEGLYLEVLDDALKHAVKVIKASSFDSEELSLPARVALIIEAYFNYIEDFPELPKLVQRALLDGDQRIATVARDYTGPAIAALRRAEEEMLSEAEHYGISVFAAMVIPALYAPFFEDLLGVNLLEKKHLEARKAHIKQVVSWVLSAD